MEVKHVRDLYEAYRQVHQPQEEVEQLDEFLGSGAATMVDKATKAVQGGLQKLGVPINRTPRGPVTGPQQKQKIEGNVKEDLFDIIKGHLLDEGYADTEEAATAIMANMSEEWREDIVEAKYGTKEGRKKLAKKIRKGEEVGKSGPGTGFEAVKKAAEKGGARDPEAVAAAAMWKTHGN